MNSIMEAMAEDEFSSTSQARKRPQTVLEGDYEDDGLEYEDEPRRYSVRKRSRVEYREGGSDDDGTGLVGAAHGPGMMDIRDSASMFFSGGSGGDTGALSNDEQQSGPEDVDNTTSEGLSGAAYSSRVPPAAMTEQERHLFPDVHRTPALHKAFLYFRNFILKQFLLRPQNELVVEAVRSSIDSSRAKSHGELLHRVFHYLSRVGLINFGVYRRLSPIPELANRPRVIVLGAGVAGLAAARQLTSFGCDVVILEARERVGGRVTTFRRGNYVADLGAMVLTGLGGNPLAVLTRQISMEVFKIKQSCPLYDSSGELVSKSVDNMVEKEFNRLLEASAYLAHQLNFSHIGSTELSVGQALEMIIKLQDRHVKEKHLDHLKKIVDAQEALKKLQHDMIRSQSAIVSAQGRLAEMTPATTPTATPTTPFPPPAPPAPTTPVAASNTNATASSAATASSDAATTAGATSSGASTGGCEIDFDLRSAQYDLQNAFKIYDGQLMKRQELEIRLQQLEENIPSEVYLSTRDRQVLDWHCANLEFANAAPLSSLSLKYWDQDDDFEFSGPHVTVRSGYSQLPSRLSEGLDVRLQSPVRNINYTAHGVEVIASGPSAASRAEVHTADAVLVTAPLGVLKSNSITFNPPLPGWKADAIRRMGFGNLNKVILCFEKAFWDPTLNLFAHVNTTTAERGDCFLFWNIYRAPTLIALNAGESATRLEAFPDHVVVRKAMDALRQIFNEITIPEPREAVVTRWKTDPWARGSYSYVAVGSSGADYDFMAAPVSVPAATASKTDTDKPRLFFAGEHTVRNYPATVHGALLSGLREAGRIADHFLGAPYAKKESSLASSSTATMPHSYSATNATTATDDVRMDTKPAPMTSPLNGKSSSNGHASQASHAGSNGNGDSATVTGVNGVVPVPLL